MMQRRMLSLVASWRDCPDFVGHGHAASGRILVQAPGQIWRQLQSSGSVHSAPCKRTESDRGCSSYADIRRKLDAETCLSHLAETEQKFHAPPTVHPSSILAKTDKLHGSLNTGKRFGVGSRIHRGNGEDFRLREALETEVLAAVALEPVCPERPSVCSPLSLMHAKT